MQPTKIYAVGGDRFLVRYDEEIIVLSSKVSTQQFRVRATAVNVAFSKTHDGGHSRAQIADWEIASDSAREVAA